MINSSYYVNWKVIYFIIVIYIIQNRIQFLDILKHEFNFK